MIKWRNSFSSKILSRGLEYYRYHRVIKLTKKNEATYTAIVEGESDYQVEIRKDSRNKLIMTCSCPYAETSNCKHMAATMLAIERHDLAFLQEQKQKEEIDEPDSSKTPKDFFKPLPEDSYFNLEPVFRKYTFEESDYIKAKSLIESGQFRFIRIDLAYSYNGSQELRATANDTCITLGKNSVSNFYSMQDRLVSSFHSSKQKMGVRMIAILILLNDYLRKENPGDFTDFSGFQLTDVIKKQNRKSIKKLSFDELEKKEQASSIIDIVPCIDYENYYDFSVSFSIKKEQAKKSYIVKNCNTLAEVFSKEGRLVYGKDLTVDFSVDKLSERAKLCLDFILFCKSITYRNLTRDITIDEDNFELFYKMFSKTEVLNVNGRVVEFKEGTINFDSKVKPILVNNKEEGLNIRFEALSFFSGTDDKFTVAQDCSCVYRIPKEKIGPLSELFNSYEYKRSKEFSCNLGKKKLKDFSSTVLPALKYYGNVDFSECSDISQWEADYASFSFNLDYSEGKVSCITNVSYGNEKLNLLDNNSQISRDLEAENHVKLQLNEIFGNIDDSGWFVYEADKIYLLLTKGISILLEMGEVNATDSFNNLKIRKNVKPSSTVSMDAGLLELEIKTQDLSVQELLELISSYKKKKVYHRLKDGSFVDINESDISEMSEFFDALALNRKDLIKGKIKIPAFRALYIDKLANERNGFFVERDDSFKNIIRDFEKFKESDAAVPVSLSNVLRTYQQEGFKWLSTLGKYGFGGILADEMGLGKTLQILSYLLYRKQKGIKKPSLVVCPASLVYNWSAEASKFVPELSVLTVSGKQTEREALIKNCNSHDLVLTSYDLLKRDIAEYQDCIFDCLIIDEAQFIKNTNTEASKSVKAINSKLRFALTGTPIENRLSELWSIFDFLMPGFLYNYETFRREFETSSDLERLKKMISPFILRRLKTDVLKDLPEKIEECRFSELATEQRKIYDAQVTKIKMSLRKTKESDFNKNKIAILAELTRLRQICCDPSLVFEDYREKSSKRCLCSDLIESAVDGGHKVLVFSQFASMLAFLEKDLENSGLEYYKIEGATDKQKRVELVNAFNENEVPVFLISLKAGGTGLNLTGADIVIHYDPWWNVAVQNQATDRAHRIGQNKVVTVYKLVAKDTIEEKIMELQDKKKSLAEELLSSENVSLSSLSREDILEILG